VRLGQVLNWEGVDLNSVDAVSNWAGAGCLPLDIKIQFCDFDVA
jgi:hypothetical protein